MVFCVVPSSRESFLCSSWRSAEAKLRAEGLSGGVDSPETGVRMIVFLQGSQNPEAYAIGCWQVLQIATVFEGEIVALLLNLKSKLDLAEAMTVAEVRGRSEAEERCGDSI